MKKNSVAVIASLFSVLLLSSIALADVYVPPGPGNSMDAWITPTLTVIDTQDNREVGWHYSDGPMYDNELLKVLPQWRKELPHVPETNKLIVQFSTTVVIFGWIPKVYVSPDQVPPPVEIVITWNGIPYLVTLTLPPTQVVGWEYPPKLYADLPITYEFAWPAKTAAHYENALYNIWYGDIDDYRASLPWLPKRNFPFGYFFWYKFHPNAGDYISFDCLPGKTMHPPTYDITALFEFSTSQIWFNHVAFDVRFLDVHKTILPNPILGKPETQTVIDTISIKNIGKATATELDIFQTFPSTHEVSVLPRFYTALAKVFDANGELKAGPAPLPNLGLAWPYDLPAPFDKLLPGEELIITMEIGVATETGWGGTIVFDLEVSAAEIPEWKYPRSMEGLIVGDNVGEPVYLWVGLELINIEGVWIFTTIPEWKVPTPVIRMPIEEVPPDMILDPVPVDLNGDGKINGADVAIVRQAIVGLLPYKQEMDINVNGKIDTQDLAAYKLVAG